MMGEFQKQEQQQKQQQTLSYEVKDKKSQPFLMMARGHDRLTPKSKYKYLSIYTDKLIK
jgi:hypothetical protein